MLYNLYIQYFIIIILLIGILYINDINFKDVQLIC